MWQALLTFCLCFLLAERKTFTEFVTLLPNSKPAPLIKQVYFLVHLSQRMPACLRRVRGPESIMQSSNRASISLRWQYLDIYHVLSARKNQCGVVSRKIKKCFLLTSKCRHRACVYFHAKQNSCNQFEANILHVWSVRKHVPDFAYRIAKFTANLRLLIDS